MYEKDAFFDTISLMRIRLYNALIYPSLALGEIWTAEDKIIFAGEKPRTIPQNFDKQIDIQGNLIMPGFKNAHAHSTMTFLRSKAEGLPLARWLNDAVWPEEDKLTEELVYKYTRIALEEYIQGGITAAFDQYFFTEAVAQAFIDSGVRLVVCTSFTTSKPADEIAKIYEKFNSLHPLVSCRLGFHAEYTAEPEMLINLAKVAREYRAPVFFHNSETRQEVRACIQRRGITPTQYAASFGLLKYGGGGFHSVFLNKDDIALYKDSGTAAITCPASNLKLASGIAPLKNYQAAQIKLGIGTDGPASNNALDMFREMYLATVLQNIRFKSAAAGTPEFWLNAAACENARIIGLDNADALEAGKLADLIVIDLAAPNMLPRNDILKNTVLAGGKQNVLLTMVAGKILFERTGR